MAPCIADPTSTPRRLFTGSTFPRTPPTPSLRPSKTYILLLINSLCHYSPVVPSMSFQQQICTLTPALCTPPGRLLPPAATPHLPPTPKTHSSHFACLLFRLSISFSKPLTQI